MWTLTRFAGGAGWPVRRSAGRQQAGPVRALRRVLRPVAERRPARVWPRRCSTRSPWGWSRAGHTWLMAMTHRRLRRARPLSGSESDAASPTGGDGSAATASVLKAGAQYLPSRLAPALAGLLLIPVLGRSLSPEAFGKYALVNATLAYVAALAGDWLISGYQRAAQSSDAEQTRTITRALVLASGLTAACLVLYGAVAGAVVPLGVGLVLLPFQLLKLQLVGLQMAERSGRYSTLSVLYSVLKSAAIGGAALATNQLTPVVLAWAVATLVVLLLGPSLRLCSSWRGLVRSLPDLRPIAAIGLPLVLTSLMLNISATADRYIVAGFEGYAQAGVYSFGYVLGETLVALPASVPFLAAYAIVVRRHDAGDTAGAKLLVQSLLRLQTAAAALVVCVVTIAAGPLVDVLAEDRYADAASLLPGITAAQVLASMLSYYVLAFTLHRRPRATLLPFVVTGVVNLVLTTALVAWTGLTGAVLATAVTYAVAVTLLDRAASERLLGRPTGTLAAGTLAVGLLATLGIAPEVRTALAAVLAGSACWMIWTAWRSR